MRLRKRLFILRRLIERIIQSEITHIVPIILLILIAHIAILIWVIVSQIYLLFNTKQPV